MLAKVSLLFLVGHLPDTGINGSASSSCWRWIWHVLHANIGRHCLLYGVRQLRQHVDVLLTSLWSYIWFRIALRRPDAFQCANLSLT